MVSVVSRTLLLFGLTAGLWYLRQPIHLLVGRLGPTPLRGSVKNLLSFVFDESLQANWLRSLSPYLNKFALRVPALVLMYSAATNNLMMPSFPLEAETDVFKYAQVGLALMILTEWMLPVVGWALIALVSYTAVAYGPIVSIDALPLLALAYVYLTMPSRSGSRALTIGPEQVRWMRVIMGISFVWLGIMKIVNYELVIGVADHAPVIMADPMIKLFWLWTDPQYPREWWAFGFGMAEILTGSLLMSGMFKRVIGLSMSLVFTKLMIYDIGWQEIPHLYPISVLIMICFSNVAPAHTADRQRGASNGNAPEATNASLS